MAAILGNSAAVATVVVVVRTGPRAIPLAMITMGKLTHGFPFLSHLSMGLRMADLRAAGAPQLMLLLSLLLLISLKILDAIRISSITITTKVMKESKQTIYGKCVLATASIVLVTTLVETAVITNYTPAPTIWPAHPQASVSIGISPQVLTAISFSFKES